MRKTALLLLLLVVGSARAMIIRQASVVSVTTTGGGGDVTAAGNNAFTGNNTFAGTSDFSGAVTISTLTSVSSATITNATITNLIGTATEFTMQTATATALNVSTLTVTSATANGATVFDLVLPGTFTIQGVDYAFPTSGGAVNQVLTNDGGNNLTWNDQSGGGNAAILTATQTFTGSNTFGVIDGTTTLLNRISYGGTLVRDLGYLTIEAVSIDGATQSSACFGVVGVSSSADDAFLTFTSSTTIGNAEMHGVLKEECSPGETCVVQIYGIVLAEVGNTPLTIGNGCRLFSTRCQFTQDVIAFNTIGCKIMTTGAPVGSNDWVLLGY